MPRGAASSRPWGAWGRERNVPIASAPGVHGNICGWGEFFFFPREMSPLSCGHLAHANCCCPWKCQGLLHGEVQSCVRAPLQSLELSLFPKECPSVGTGGIFQKSEGFLCAWATFQDVSTATAKGRGHRCPNTSAVLRERLVGSPSPFFNLLILTPAGWVSRTVPGPWVLCPSGVLLPPPGLSILQGAEWCCWIPSCYLVPFWLLGPVTCGCLCRDFRPDSHAGGEAR